MTTKEEKRIEHKIWRDANRDKVKASKDKYRASNLEKVRKFSSDWHKLHPEKQALATKQYLQRNPGLGAAKCAKYRAAKLQATPPWLTAEQLAEIKWWYETAQELQWLSEEPLAVDHIEPLQGKISCGFHVPWNLQILSKSANSTKGNRL